MQSLVQSTDYIVCLSLETTASSCNVRRMFNTPHDRLSQLTAGAKTESAPEIKDLSAFLSANGANLPRIIHMDWCVCSVKDFKVLESNHAIVNPGVPLDAATFEQTKVTQAIVGEQGVTLDKALEKVSTNDM